MPNKKAMSQIFVVVIVVALMIFFLVPVIWMDAVPCLIRGYGYASPSYYLFHHGFAYVHREYAYLTPTSFYCI